jgi:hypothetical protein
MKFLPLLMLELLFTACFSTEAIKRPFTVDYNSPRILAGTIEAQFDELFSLSGIRKDAIVVDYYPMEDAVCLQYKYNFSTYYQYWDKNGREAFVKALQKYKEDFSQQNLGKSSKKTRRNYGTVKGYLMWQMAAYTIRGSGEMNMEIGYYFREKAPFFTVNQRKAMYFFPETGNFDRESPEIVMYFTRAQADNLAELFDPWYLRGLITTDFISPEAEIDEY